MVHVKVAGLSFGGIEEVLPTLCVGNCVRVVTEENKRASNGVAYAVECKGKKIGYIPELKTLRKQYKEAYTEPYRNEVEAWGKRTAALRAHFNEGGAEWYGKIVNIIFQPNSIDWAEWSNLGEPEGYTVSAVIVMFEGVEWV